MGISAKGRENPIWDNVMEIWHGCDLSSVLCEFHGTIDGGEEDL